MPQKRRNRTRIRRFLLLAKSAFPPSLAVISLALWLGQSWVRAETMAQTGHAEIRLLSEQRQIATGQSFWLGLQLSPETGWHTYWKNPGDAGKATTVKWNLPSGWKASPLHWPYPRRIRTGSLVSFGYTNKVNLLTEITANTVSPGTRKIEISALVDWLVCEEICIPENAALSLSLPLGPEAESDPGTVPIFRDTRAVLPRDVSWKGNYIYNADRLVFDVPLRLIHMDGGNGDFVRNKNRTVSDLEGLLFFPVEDNLIENASGQSFLLSENRVRVSVSMGYLQQTESFQGVLVLKRAGGIVEAVEFTADPVKQLPAFIEQ
jgi:DsbC/DsbD-like thiol-disulfide interchange protein